MTPPPTAPRSVWTHPERPAVEASPRHVRVRFGGETIADSRRALRVLERGVPPAWYLPPEDLRWERLDPARRSSRCAHKGEAEYLSVRVGEAVARCAAWRYPEPTPELAAIRGHVAFYAHLVEAALDGERAAAPDWRWLGGWVTADVTGPFLTPTWVAAERG